MAEPPMPDLSHLTDDERQIIEEVLKRQKAEEDKDAHLQEQSDKELDDIERQIAERQARAQKMIGTQDDAICQICQKTKFADGIGHKCYYCQLRTCARCGGRTQLKGQKVDPARAQNQSTAAQNKNIWACSLCQKRQQILAKTGKWFHTPETPGVKTPTTPVGPSPTLPGSSSSAQPSSVLRPQQTSAPTGIPGPQQPMQQQPVPRHSVSGPGAQGPSGSRINHVPPAQVPHQPQTRAPVRREPTLNRQSSVTSAEDRERSAERQRRASEQRMNGRDPRAPPPDYQRKPTPPDYGYPDERAAPRIATPPEHRNDYRTGAPGRRTSEYEHSDSRRTRDDERRTPPYEPRPKSPREQERLRSRSPTDYRERERDRERDRQVRTPTQARGDYEDTRRDFRRESSRDGRDGDWYSPPRDYPPPARRGEGQPPYVNGQRAPPREYGERYSDSDFRREGSREPRPPSPSRASDPYRRADSPGRHASSRDRTAPVRRTPEQRSEAKNSRDSRTAAPISGNGQRPKLDMNVRTDSLSSETSEQPRARHRNNRQPSQQAQSAKSALVPSRYRRSKLPRQHRSYSSSDEELPSTSECPSCEEPDLESESFSERGDSDVSKKRWKDEEMLAAKIKKFLSHPVTWQPSADGRRLIGHMVLHRYASGAKGDLGLKVVGGRRTELGQLGAFITRVKRGSVADTVGHLRAGDEVLEWNSRKLQNATFEQVYEIISDSKHEPQVELIVSRSTSSPGGDDFLELKSKPPSHRVQPMVGAMNELLPQLEAMGVQAGQVTPIPSGLPIAALPGSSPGIVPLTLPPASAIPVSASGAPLVMVTGPPDPMLAAGMAHQQQQLVLAQQIGSMPARGQIFGRIQLSLYFALAERQLVVTVHQACDLPPRADGTPRNPYVKMFLLPDRSEKSRRQSKVLAGTCIPVWQQPFIYQNLTDQDLLGRVLEVTLWDYDKYATNDFLGEVLIELAVVSLNNEPQWYTLTDMDEENPVRAKVRQQRLSAYLGRQQQIPTDQMPFDPYGAYPAQPFLQDVGLASSSGYRSDSGITPMARVAGMPRSKTYASHRQRHPQAVSQDEAFEDEYGVLMGAGYSGYLSDHGYSSRSASYQLRRPRSATQMRPPRDLRPGSPTEMTKDWSKRNLPHVPADMYGEEGMADVQRLGPSRPQGRSRRQAGRKLRALPMDPSSPGDMQLGTAGYVSDGSETSMSVTSTQSERPRRKPYGQLSHEYTNSLEVAPEEEEVYGLVDSQDGTMSDSAVGSAPISSKSAQMASAKERDRKKSLMTRLIPGRAGQGGLGEGKKRLGFPRSEEVGIPAPLQGAPRVNAASYRPELSYLAQQCSSESGGSADSSWMPVLPDGPLGDFVTDLGPGQVVGRQVLASPVLGEIQIGIASKRGNLEVEIVRARNLVVKTGAKINPAPYVKVYLMEGKVCVAKAKTTISRRTTEPYFQQQLVFNETYAGRMLQITVWGDYGRIERKAFMGIAQIRLDDLNLTAPSIGWYKLYHSSSLVGTGSSPARKDSQSSLPDYMQQQQQLSPRT